MYWRAASLAPRRGHPVPTFSKSKNRLLQSVDNAKRYPPLKDTPLSFGSKKLGRRPADCACSGPQAQDFLLWTARPACVTEFVHILITLLYLYLIAIHLVQKFNMKSGQLIFVLFFRPKKLHWRLSWLFVNFLIFQEERISNLNESMSCRYNHHKQKWTYKMSY